MDAINTLRMGSRNRTYDKDTWRVAFLGNGSEYVHNGICGQEWEEQFPLIANYSNKNDEKTNVDANAQLHCVEALPSTARRLQATAQSLGWDSQFKVQHAAMAATDGVTRFPFEDGLLGKEDVSMSSCDAQKDLRCINVTTFRLDTYTETFGLSNASIQILSIDAEGHDWAVLSSGVETLKRTMYLEFEYHFYGVWHDQSLKQSIEWLKEQGFVCYWAGRHGHVWRITDCWQDYYETKFWSNVACIKASSSSSLELANIMEAMFLETLAKNYTIQYAFENSTRT